MATEIDKWKEMDDVRLAPEDDYDLIANLGPSDADYATIAGPLANSSTGWNPIVGPYTGIFDGGGFTLDTLTIDKIFTTGVALFAVITTGTVKNLKMTNADIDGDAEVGMLVGEFTEGTIENCSCQGAVNVRKTSSSYGGGLVGKAQGTGSGSISKSFSAGTLNGKDLIGGFAGLIFQVSVDDCDSTMTITGAGGTNRVGGFSSFVGDNDCTNCYYAGDMTGIATTRDGGFSAVGVGGTLSTACFWDTQLSGHAVSNTGTGKTTSEMQTESTFTGAGWDFSTIWEIAASSYPNLQWEVPAVVLEILENFHDGSDGYKVEYNVTDGAYRITHGSENVEFTYDRSSGVIRRVSNYNASTKELEFFINGASQGTHVFTNALVMPGSGDYTVEYGGDRVADELSIEGTHTDSTDVTEDYGFFT